MEIMQSSKPSVSPPMIVENLKRLNEHLQEKKSPQEKLAGQQQLDVEQMQELVEEANEHFTLTRTNLQYELHEELEEYYVQILNAETQEVIREVPPTYLLDMAYKIQKHAGLIVDEQV